MEVSVSIRTIIEFNHDYTNEVERDRGSLSSLLTSAMRLARVPPEVEAHLRRYGIRVLTSRHHPDALKIEVGGVVQHEEGEGRKA
jgi:hypothetical protein